jgi:hypothetical protein
MTCALCGVTDLGVTGIHCCDNWYCGEDCWAWHDQYEGHVFTVWPELEGQETA